MWAQSIVLSGPAMMALALAAAAIGSSTPGAVRLIVMTTSGTALKANSTSAPDGGRTEGVPTPIAGTEQGLMNLLLSRIRVRLPACPGRRHSGLRSGLLGDQRVRKDADPVGWNRERTSSRIEEVRNRDEQRVAGVELHQRLTMERLDLLCAADVLTNGLHDHRMTAADDRHTVLTDCGSQQRRRAIH